MALGRFVKIFNEGFDPILNRYRPNTSGKSLHHKLLNQYRMRSPNGSSCSM